MPSWTQLNAYGDKRHDGKNLIAVWAYHCYRCGYIWLPRDFDIDDVDTLDREPPKSCARCKSKYYDRPYDEYRKSKPSQGSLTTLSASIRREDRKKTPEEREYMNKLLKSSMRRWRREEKKKESSG